MYARKRELPVTKLSLDIIYQLYVGHEDFFKKSKAISVPGRGSL
jgi:hypothetical protein